MKKSPCLFIATWVAALGATEPVAPGGRPPAAVEVPFTRTFQAADLTIERLTVELLGNDVRFVVSYTSGRERFLVCFDPPKGNAIKHVDRSALKKGTGEAAVAIPLEKLRGVREVTMRFSAPNDAETDRNFAFVNLNNPVLRPILGDRSVAASRAETATRKGGPVKEVAPNADIRSKDVSGVAGLDAEKIKGLKYNQGTRWNSTDAAVSRDYLQRGMNPGLGVLSLHRAGIIGAGVSVGIVDQNIHLNHPEFKDRIAGYKDVGCNATEGSMHGPAVASLLVGKNIGTAPGARLYFAAAPSWTADVKFQADGLNWLLDVNATLPAAEKIHVISVSAAPSGAGSPFKKNQALWDEACERATQAGVLVLDCTSHRGLIGACYYDIDAPDDLARVVPGFPGRLWQPRANLVLAPSSRRTQAEEYVAGEFGYQYSGVGGLSWSIPYAAGVLALGWQVNPQLSADRMVELLRQSAYEKNGAKIINPVAFIEAVKRQ